MASPATLSAGAVARAVKTQTGVSLTSSAVYSAAVRGRIPIAGRTRAGRFLFSRRAVAVLAASIRERKGIREP